MDPDSNAPYRGLYKTAFFSALVMLVIIPLQIAVFSIIPLPETIPAWFDLFNRNILVGLFHSDLFILINNVLIAVIYLAFYHTLKKTNKGMMQIALVLGLVGRAAYISSNKSFELLMLAKAYAGATLETDKTILLTAGQAMISGWQGTAFDAYYVLNGITLFIIAILMFKNDHYKRSTASFGLAAAIFMIIPSTAGTLGLVFSLLSLIPWYIFTIKFARVFRQLGKG